MGKNMRNYVRLFYDFSFFSHMLDVYKRQVVGTKSYGKGTVQELITTSSGNEYKFTTKKWLTPKGNWIHKKGVEPDVKIDLSEEYKNNPSEENDNQYNKAIEEAIKER